jgi:DNA repair protein RecN (Recombination protein N)
VLGNRADTGIMKDPGIKCIVEAEFDIESYSMKPLFEENNIDYDRLTVVRREITPSGKSRAFINDTPVNLGLVRQLGEYLIDIHSQHSSLLLNDPSFQLSVVDSFAGINSRVEAFRTEYEHFTSRRSRLIQMEQDETEARKEEDYFRFLFEELEKAQLSKDEIEELEEQQKVLSHAEEIKEKLYSAVETVLQGEENILSKLKETGKGIQKFSQLHKGIEELNERFGSAIIELEDIAKEYESIEKDIEFNPVLLQEVNERLDMIYKLQHKHNAGSVRELLDIKDNLDTKLQNISSLSDEIEKLRKEVDRKSTVLRKEAGAISKLRKGVFPELEKKTSDFLTRMGMPDGRVKINHRLLDVPGTDGIDSVTFLFTANKGIEPDNVSKIASGGELSRLMLSLKSLISEKRLLPTIIFDEIDNGISGDIAGRVGEVMLNASQNMQVIAITHLPQIAGKGSHHYRVYKETGGATAVTKLRKIEGEERVMEIATMLSGEEQTGTTRETAREFLKSDNHKHT